MQVGITHPVSAVYPGQVTTPAQVTAPLVPAADLTQRLLNTLIPILGIALIFTMIRPLFKEVTK